MVRVANLALLPNHAEFLTLPAGITITDLRVITQRRGQFTLSGDPTAITETTEVMIRIGGALITAGMSGNSTCTQARSLSQNSSACAASNVAVLTLVFVPPPELQEEQRKDFHEITLGTLSKNFVGSNMRMIEARMGSSRSHSPRIKVGGNEVKGIEQFIAKTLYDGVSHLGEGNYKLQVPDLMESLNDGSFEMPIGTDSSFWIGGGVQFFEGDPTRSGITSDYKGSTKSTLFGIDRRTELFTTGISLGFNFGSTDYTFTTGAVNGDGGVETFGGSIYPYFAVHPYKGMTFWALGGIGFGKHTIEENYAASDIFNSWDVTSLDWVTAGGLEQAVAFGALDFTARAKAMWYGIKISEAVSDSGSKFSDLTSLNQRFRFEGEAGYTFNFSDHLSVRPYGLGSVRYDTGDASVNDNFFVDAGGGFELNAYNAIGLNFGGSAQVLGDETKEYSGVIVAAFSYDRGLDGRGMEVSIKRALESGDLISRIAPGTQFNDVKQEIRSTVMQAKIAYNWNDTNAYARSQINELDGRHNHALGAEFGFKRVNIGVETGYSSGNDDLNALARASLRL